MPLGDKALRKRNQEKDKKAGIIRDTRVLQKQERAKPDVLCGVCSQSFKVTTKNADARKHAEGKHPKKTFEELFPSLCEQSEEEEEGPADDEIPESKDGWKCAFTGNVMFSDGYTMAPVYEGMVMEVKAAEVTIGGSILIDLVAHHDLKEVKLDKAAFMAAIKAYLPRVVPWMGENGLKESVKPFRAQATEFVKFVVSKFDTFTFYTGANGDATGSIAFSYQKDEDNYYTKTFLFLNQGLIQGPL